MNRILLLCLVTSISLCSACSSLPTNSQIEDWKGKVDRSLATVSTGIEKGKEIAKAAEAKYDELKGKYDALKADYDARRESLEAIAGPMDANGDGKVTTGEVAEFSKALSKTPAGRDALLDWQTYAVLAASWLGVKGTKKTASMIARAAYNHGKDLDGDGKDNDTGQPINPGGPS